MARVLIRPASGAGVDLAVDDSALPFFPGYIIAAVLDPDGDVEIYPSRAEMDARYAQVTDLNKAGTRAGDALRAAFVRAGTKEFDARNYPSIQATIDAAATAGGGVVRLAESRNLTATLTLPATVPVWLVADRGVKLTATAAMTAMIHKPAGYCLGGGIIDLDLDGNLLAERCVDYLGCYELIFSGGTWENATIAVVDLGRTGEQLLNMSWSETTVKGINASRSDATPAKKPAYGIRFGALVTDNSMTRITVVNANVGILDAGAANDWTRAHVYSYPYGAGTTASYVGECGYRVTGSINRYIDCYSDTQILGFDLSAAGAERNTLENPRFYWPLDYNPGVDITGVRCGVGTGVIGGVMNARNASLTGYPFVMNNVFPVVITGFHAFGNGFTDFWSVTGAQPFAAANVWHNGAGKKINYGIDLGTGALTAGAADIAGAAGTNRELRWRTGTSLRAMWRLSNGAESGDAAGSDLLLNTYKDDGSFGFTVAQVQRQHGMWTLPRSQYRLRATQTLAAAGAVAIDSAAGNHHRVLLQANATSTTVQNASSLAVGKTPLTGQELTIAWQQDATGGRTYAWPANCRFAGGAAPADTTPNTRTSVSFIYESGVWCETGRAVAVPTA